MSRMRRCGRVRARGGAGGLRHVVAGGALLSIMMLLRAATLVGMCAAGAEGQVAPGKIEATCHFNATTQVVEGGGISSGTMYITYVPGVGATTDVITEGMTPGLHGIHIHDFGDLSNTETGTSTGPHYNPLDEIVRPRCVVRSRA